MRTAVPPQFTDHDLQQLLTIDLTQLDPPAASAQSGWDWAPDAATS